MIDRSKSIFGNVIAEGDYRSACRTKAGYMRRFGDDSGAGYHLAIRSLPVIGRRLGTTGLAIAGPDEGPLELPPNAMVIGNIRMGFGHYRIAMAFASCAHALGFAPYWLDLASLTGTTCSKVIRAQNDLYSLGSRLSQKVGAFNKLVWEPLNSEGFRKLSYNASDQKVAELMAAPLGDLPRDVPYVGTHAWPSQAAVHAGLTHVYNAIPDNWPMALHLAEGAAHFVQTPSACLGYRMLRGMDPKRALAPMPGDAIAYVGHYVDHELVAGIEEDCAARERRLAAGEPLRLLLSVGGAGAQLDLFAQIVGHLLPSIDAGRVALMVNVGDHRDVWDGLVRKVPRLAQLAQLHFDDFDACAAWAHRARAGEVHGVHAFCHEDIFAAVYSTNLLMRACDVLATKPSELSFYPVPKLMIRRVGGHEAWGAIRAAEVGDGTYECETFRDIAHMLDCMVANPDIVAGMCDHIRRNKKAGIYDGAYLVCQLAKDAVRGR